MTKIFEERVIPLKQYEQELYCFDEKKLGEIDNLIIKVENDLDNICSKKLINTEFSMITYLGCAHRTYEKESRLGIIQGVGLLTEEEHRSQSLNTFRRRYNTFFESIRSNGNNLTENLSSLRLMFILMGYTDTQTVLVEREEQGE